MSKEPKSTPKYTKKQKGLILGLILLGLYALLGFKIVPLIIKDQGIKILSDLSDREVGIKNVEFNPFNFLVLIEEFKVQKEERSPLISFDSVRVNFQLSTLFTMKLTFAELSIYQPTIHLEHYKEGELSVSDLIHKFSSTENTSNIKEEPSKKAELIPLEIETFRLYKGALTLKDYSSTDPRELNVTPISFHVDNFSTQLKQGDDNKYVLNAAGPSGSVFKWEGSFQLSPFLSEGAMEFDNLKLSNYADFYKDFVEFDIPNGVVGFKTEYKLFEKPEFGLSLSNTDLSVNDLGLAFVDSLNQEVKLKQFKLSGMAVDLLKKSVAIKSINLERVEVVAQRDKNGEFDLVKKGLKAKDSLETTKEPLNIDSLLGQWTLSLDTFDLNIKKIELEDRQFSKPLRLNIEEGDLAVYNLKNTEVDTFKISYQSKINSEGRVNLNAAGLLNPLSIDMDLVNENIPMTIVNPIVNEFVEGSITNGVLNTSLKLSLNLNDSLVIDTLNVKGDLDLKSLKVVDKKLKSVISLRSVKVQKINADLLKNKIDISSLNVYKPKVNVIRNKEESINLIDWIKATKKAPSKTKAANSLKLNLRRLNINGFEANIYDHVPNDIFQIKVNRFSGSVRNIRNTKNSISSFDLKGKYNDYSDLNITGVASLFAKEPSVDVKLTSDNLDMIGLSPYSGTFAGLLIDKGQVSTELNYTLRGQKIKGSNRVVVNSLEFGNSVESDKATLLPVKLGVALLSDKNGIIDLDVGVEGDFESQEISVGGLVWQALLNVLEKAIMSPFRALLSLGDDDDKINEIEFEPASSLLNVPQKEQLLKIATALKEKPMLQVEVFGAIDSLLDIQQIKENTLINKMLPTEKQSGNIDRNFFRSDKGYPLLKKLLTQEKKQFVVDKIMAQDTVTQIHLNEVKYNEMWNELVSLEKASSITIRRLSQNRAAEVKKYFVEVLKVDGSRVFVVEAIEIENNLNQAKVILSLKVN